MTSRRVQTTSQVAADNCPITAAHPLDAMNTGHRGLCGMSMPWWVAPGGHLDEAPLEVSANLEARRLTHRPIKNGCRIGIWAAAQSSVDNSSGSDETGLSSCGTGT
jgi:hypothetical protein